MGRIAGFGLLVGLVALSACFSTADDRDVEGARGQSVEGSESATDAPPEDYVVRDTVEVVGLPDGDRSWSWTVASHERETFAVEVWVTGPDGIPRYHAEDTRVVVEGGVGDDHFMTSWGDNGGGVSAGTSSSAIVFTAKDVPLPLGPWKITAELGPGAYAVHVDVELVF